MSEPTNEWKRQPRSASNRLRVGAQIGGQWKACPVETDELPLVDSIVYSAAEHPAIENTTMDCFAAEYPTIQSTEMAYNETAHTTMERAAIDPTAIDFPASEYNAIEYAITRPTSQDLKPIKPTVIDPTAMVHAEPDEPGIDVPTRSHRHHSAHKADDATAYQAADTSFQSAKSQDVQVFEDTSTLLTVPEYKTFWSKQPPIFWLVAALLMVSLFTVTGFIGVNRWHENDLARKEAKRLQQLADEKAKYKFLYRDLIETYASQSNIDPALVASVIYNESRFEPKAVSSVGARGLMQIMEKTGPWIADNLNESATYSFDSLFIPETNIRYGTWYLGFLSKRFGGDLVKIAAGYHAGQGRVASWLTNTAYSHDGWTLDVIPIPETEQYVRKVVNAYEIYTKHYYAPADTTPEGSVS